MKRGKTMLGIMALLVASACGTTPTAAPSTANAPTAASVASAAPTTAPQASALPAATAAPSTAATAAATTAAPSAAAATPGAVRSVAAGEVVKLSGNSFTTSDTYRFASDTTLDITWNYTGTAPFALWLINVSENVTDPNYDRILVDDVTGPHAGSMKQKIIAGDWTVQVEQAAGPWLVQFTPES